MQALVVVPVGPAARRQSGAVDRAPGTRPGAAHPLGLVEGVDGLGEGVVERVTDAADRGTSPDLVELPALADGGHRAAGVRENDQSLEVRAAMLSAGHLQGAEDPFGAQVGGHSPTDDHRAEGVGDEIHGGDGPPGRHVGQVHDPGLGGSRGAEVALDEVRRAQLSAYRQTCRTAYG